MDHVLTGANEVNIHANVPRQGDRTRVPADGDELHVRVVHLPGAVNSPTVRPDDRGAQRLRCGPSTPLENSVSGTNGTLPVPGDFGKGCIDIARSSGRAPWRSPE